MLLWILGICTNTRITVNAKACTDMADDDNDDDDDKGGGNLRILLKLCHGVSSG